MSRPTASEGGFGLSSGFASGFLPASGFFSSGFFSAAFFSFSSRSFFSFCFFFLCFFFFFFSQQFLFFLFQEMPSRRHLYRDRRARDRRLLFFEPRHRRRSEERRVGKECRSRWP